MEQAKQVKAGILGRNTAVSSQLGGRFISGHGERASSPSPCRPLVIKAPRTPSSRSTGKTFLFFLAGGSLMCQVEAAETIKNKNLAEGS